MCLHDMFAVCVMCRDLADPVHVSVYDNAPHVCHVCSHDCVSRLVNPRRATSCTLKTQPAMLSVPLYCWGATFYLKTFIRLKIGGL